MNEERLAISIKLLFWIAIILIFLFATLVLVNHIDDKISLHNTRWIEMQERITQDIPSPPRLEKKD